MFTDKNESAPAATYSAAELSQIEQNNLERGFTMGEPAPLQVRTDLPVTEGEVVAPSSAETLPSEPVTVDGQIVPAGLLPMPERGFTMGESKPVETRTDIPVVEGEVVAPATAETLPSEPVTVDGQIIPAGYLPAPPPTEFEHAVQYNRSLWEAGQHGLMHNRGVSDTSFAESLLKQYRLAKSGETGKPAPVLPVEALAREQQNIADNEPAALDQQTGVIPWNVENWQRKQANYSESESEYGR